MPLSAPQSPVERPLLHALAYIERFRRVLQMLFCMPELIQAPERGARKGEGPCLVYVP